MEKDTIDMNKKSPNTLKSLKSNMKNLGLKEDMDIVVHSSLSKIGWIVGGEVTVVEALKEVITEGTIIMPSHTANLSEPSYWGNPAVPESWWETIRESMPGFDKKTSVTRQMGRVVEYFRGIKGAIRSTHPQNSFVSYGKNKEYIINNHPLDYSIGNDSPLGKLYELDGYIILIGVDFNNNTSIHLAENKSNVMKKIAQGSPIIENSRRVWKTYIDIGSTSCDFLDIQKEFFKLNKHTEGKIGEATTYLMKIRDLVDFATGYIIKNDKQRS